MAAWRNPPLACIVAGVHYDRLLNFKERVLPAFQSKCGGTLPGYEVEEVELEQQLPVGVRIGIKQERHVFKTVEQTSGVVLGDQGLLFYQTEYDTFEPFSVSFKEIIGGLSEAVALESSGPPLIRRVGLRAVDRLLPDEGREPESFFIEGIQTSWPEVDQAAFKGQMIFRRLAMVEGALDIRITTGYGVPPIPSDLQPLPVMDIYPKTKEEFPDERLAGMLDIDRYLTLRKPLDPDELTDVLRGLHVDLDQMFLKLISKEAKRFWGAP